jgi:mannose-6-phosphate isomerase-like protein (cupin superfamily)
VDESVNLADKLAAFDDRWSPKVVGLMNDYKLAVVKVEGEFVWHRHEETDDFFLVIEGHLFIDLREGGRERTVEVAPGELFVVPRGVEHRPRADRETHILLIEPAGTVNTGDAGGPLTAAEETL